MLWTAGSLSGVIAVYLAVIYWVRATKANKSGPQWGLGALVVYLAIMGVIYIVIRLLGLQDYMQIWIACVLWFVVTIAAGIKTDSIFASKLPVANG
jgi:hypothetical protein